MCRQFKVSGRVQGVFYRDSTRAVAASLGIHGHAVNLSDGSVEVRACGAANDLEELRSWLWRGPQLADVKDVVEQPVECTDPGEFRTG
jgi:acylphosphatase